jgi:hypothetical protein
LKRVTVLRALTRLGPDVVAGALGLNLWVSLVLVPALFVGAFDHHPGLVLLTPLPLLALGIGVARRSPVWLLLTFPATLLLPIALEPRTIAENTQGVVTFALVGASLIGFLFGASYLSQSSPLTDAPLERLRRLSSADRVPPRWKRRMRVYRALAVLSAVFPAVLLYAVDFAPTTRAFLEKMYPGRVSSMLALMNLGVLGLWLSLFALAFLSPLAHHRTGDRPLTRKLEQLEKEAKQGTPRAAFYLAVLCALGFMALLIFLRYH